MMTISERFLNLLSAEARLELASEGAANLYSVASVERGLARVSTLQGARRSQRLADARQGLANAQARAARITADTHQFPALEREWHAAESRLVIELLA